MDTEAKMQSVSAGFPHWASSILVFTQERGPRLTTPRVFVIATSTALGI